MAKLNINRCIRVMKGARPVDVTARPDHICVGMFVIICVAAVEGLPVCVVQHRLWPLSAVGPSKKDLSCGDPKNAVEPCFLCQFPE